MTLMNACFRSHDKPRTRSNGKALVITHPVNTSSSPRLAHSKNASTAEDDDAVLPHRHNGSATREQQFTRCKPGASTPKDHGSPYTGSSHRTFEDKYLTPVPARTGADHRCCRLESFDGAEDSHVAISDHSDDQRKPLDGFRSSMLWSDSGVCLDDDTSDVLPTFPPDRYQASRMRNSVLGNTDACNLLKEKFSESDGSCYKLSLDVSRYAPSEVVIKLIDRKLLVEGKHFEESEFGNESCQFNRRFPIPDGTLPGDISSRIDPKGVLTIRVQAHVYRPESAVFQHARFPSGSSTSSDANVTTNRSSVSTQRLGSSSHSTSSEHRRSFYDNVDMTSNATPTKATTTMTSAPTPHQRHVSFKTQDENDGCEFIEINNDHYQLDVDVRGYAPEDLRVKVIGKELIIEGRKKTKVMTSDGHRLQTSEFTKTYCLPSKINIDTMCSRVSSKGVLKVEVWKQISEIDRDFILPADR